MSEYIFGKYKAALLLEDDLSSEENKILKKKVSTLFKEFGSLIKSIEENKYKKVLLPIIYNHTINHIKKLDYPYTSLILNVISTMYKKALNE